MADKKIKIDALPVASSVNNADIFPIVQNTSGTLRTKRTSIEDVGDHVANDQDFAELNTTSKKIIGALNEVKAGLGASTLSGLTDVSLSSLADNDVLKYDSDSGKWVNGVGNGAASQVSFNPATSGMVATNVQAAIDELAAEIRTYSGLGLTATEVHIGSAEYTSEPLS